MAIDVEGLSGPEHQEGEEIGPRDEGDEQCQRQNPRILLQSSWEHGERGKPSFPDEEADEEHNSDDDGSNYVCRSPWVLKNVSVELRRRMRGYITNLITTPLHTSHEPAEENFGQHQAMYMLGEE